MPTVRAYKGLAVVEHAFCCLKSVDLKVRPFYHHLDGRVKEHVFLCMLAYYVEWHMRRALAPVLFDDDDRGAAHAHRPPAARLRSAWGSPQVARNITGPQLWRVAETSGNFGLAAPARPW